MVHCSIGGCRIVGRLCVGECVPNIYTLDLACLSDAAIPPGIQPNRVCGCGLGVVNSYIKAFLHSIAQDIFGNETGSATL